jgi:hypothetical protein
MRLQRFCAVLALLLAVNTASAQAPAPAQSAVDLQLVLAVDASGSVNQTRFELQRHGYASAFRNPRVVQAITAGTRHAIAVAMVQWTGPTLHVQVVDWTQVSDAKSAEALAAAIDATPRRLFGGGTSLSGAIDYAMTMLGASPFLGQRRIIDVSGDGSNNAGRPAALARDEAVHAGIVINGLPITWIEPGLDLYYRDNVIGGPGAFVVAVDSYDNFADAILNKLVTEIAGLATDSHLAGGLASARRQ